MREHEKPRDAASRAVIALRTALGKTQQTFAVEDLKSAVTTVARYETSHPPRGDALLRLAEIADQAIPKHRETQTDLIKLRENFRRMYAEDVLQKIGFQLSLVPKTRSRPVQAFLLLKLEGAEEVLGAHSFYNLIVASRSKTNPERKKAATVALNSLVKASRASGIEDALLISVLGADDEE
jgi:hypothetical protein